MGYEIRMYVVEECGGSFEKIPIGNELACIELSPCPYDGPFYRLVDSKTRTVSKKETAPFGLWARNPDRQHEAVELIRGITRNVPDIDWPGQCLNKNEVNQLANDIEDGLITKDKYGSFLGVMEVDETIEALEQELKNNPRIWTRFSWALAVLKAIKDTYGKSTSTIKVVTYGH